MLALKRSSALRPLLAFAAAGIGLVTPLAAARGAEKTAASAASATAASPRERASFDAGWRFNFGHPSDTAKDFDHATAYFSYVAKAGNGDGPASPKFDDRAWRELDLPHDWAAEVPVVASGGHSHGYRAAGRGFPERSIGWYRKTFTVPAADRGRRIRIEFDGVFRDSVVWVNGFYLGRQPSGTTGFAYDLTDYLNYGGTNLIAVRTDASLEEGWYYEGAGIYRHVWLTKTAPLHVPQWGTFVTTDVADDFSRATVNVRTTIRNEGPAPTTFTLEQRVLDPRGREVVRHRSAPLTLAAGDTQEFPAALALTTPALWSLETPALHCVETTVLAGEAVVDCTTTNFGVRTVRWDADHGFFLNGKHVPIQGVNMHQDHAGVGVAVPDALLEFRVRRLKDMGANAYRTSHHPPAPELLEICDRLGFLVLDENRLMGPSPEQLAQLEAMIRRDRNHPSVILWSLGNEEWAIEGNDFGARITASMRAFAERLDPTRRTTVAISGGWGAGSSTTTDVMGYNYYTHGSTDEQHAKFPDQPGVGTEESTTQCTRGVYFTDKALAHQAHNPTHIGDSGANCINGLKHFATRPYLAGLFFWTGFDYRGESNPYSYPANSSQYGLMDTCGFAKDSFHYLRAWWTAEPVLHVYPHWNWAGRDGQEITVGCYSNHEEVELLLNGVSLGKKPVPRLDRVEWKVAYAPGVLEARGFRGGKLVDTQRVETTGPATQLVLRPDRAVITADGVDTTVFAVEARDALGRFVPTANLPVRFDLKGGKLLGVGNGDPSCLEPDQFHPALALTPVQDWVARIAPVTLTAPDAAAKLAPLQAVGDWLAPLPKPGELYECAATFTFDGKLPVGGPAPELFLPSLGVKTSVWLNGRELARDVDTTAAGPSLKLDPATLLTGMNRVQLIVTPFEGGARRLPQLARLGTFRVTTPAPGVQRSLFNGLAQVVVRAPHARGEVRLTAEAEGLASATTVVRAQ